MSLSFNSTLQCIQNGKQRDFSFYYCILFNLSAYPFFVKSGLTCMLLEYYALELLGQHELLI